jgi:hypothetical protein
MDGKVAALDALLERAQAAIGQWTDDALVHDLAELTQADHPLRRRHHGAVAGHFPPAISTGAGVR